MAEIPTFLLTYLLIQTHACSVAHTNHHHTYAWQGNKLRESLKMPQV